MKKILFINTYENLHKTKSSLFLVDFLRERGYDVTTCAFTHYHYKKLSFLKKLDFMSRKVKNIKKSLDFIKNAKNYHAIIYFQEICNMEFIAKLRTQCKNVIFVPMYDWYEYINHKPFYKILGNGVKILNFSKILQNRTSNIIEIFKYSYECKDSKYCNFSDNEGGGGKLS